VFQGAMTVVCVSGRCVNSYVSGRCVTSYVLGRCVSSCVLQGAVPVVLCFRALSEVM
jgi:hypothetical protein